jgi:hypothetical protein
MDLGVEQRRVESVYSRQWIEHVKLPSNLARGAITYEDHLENVDNKKVFFCSNRAPREARCILLLSMLRHNTLDNGYFSFLCEAPATVKLNHDQIRMYFEALRYFSDTTDENFIEYSKYIDTALKMLPIELEEDKQLQHEHVLANKSINKYRLGAFFEIVTETHDYTKESVQAGVLSEKVFWPILNQMPFIVLGHRGNTRLLHELGFKTFDEELLIESHPGDSLNMRTEYINRVIKYFYNLNKEERLTWLKQDSVREKIKYNYDKLVNTDWNQDEISALTTAFKKVMYNQ